MNFANFLLEVSTKVDPSGGAGAAASTAGSAANTAAAAAGGFMSNPISMVVIYCIVIFGALYFFSIKPQKKREKAAAEMRAALQVGDWVLMNTGMYGTIADITAECYIVEFGTNKSIRIPVLKSEVYAKREPNLSNKVEEKVEEQPKKSFFGKKKDDSEQTK